jgi:hypothetical protein
MIAPRIVKYAQPAAGEEALRFVVLEDRGDRVLLASLDFPTARFAPQEVVATVEIVDAAPATVCPDCGAPLFVDDAETEAQIWRRGTPGTMPYVEITRRPCVVAFCTGCEFAQEIGS